MLKLGSQNISALYLGGREIKRAYLGENLVFGPAPVQTYTITATIDPSGSGTVTGAGQYQEGATVTLVATAGDGYEFSGWQEGGQTVSTSATYTFTAAADRTLVVTFAVASKLPKGYTEVEYIQSSGTQYIDTGITPTTTMKVVMDVYATKTSSCLFGSTYTTGSGWIYFSILITSTSSVRALYGKEVSNATVSGTTLGRVSVFLEANGNSADCMFGNQSLEVLQGSAPDFSGSPDIFIFASNIAGASVQNRCYGYLYSCQIYDGGSIVRDFVPCVNPSGEIGLYDIVGQKFYGNAGTGSFTAGPAV